MEDSGNVINKNQPIEERLSQLWQEGARDIAISFLKRAIHPELTLAELETILRFDAVSPELDSICLRDVLAPARAAASSEVGAVPRRVAQSPAGPRAPRAGRRSPEQTEGMKQMLIATLEAKSSGLTTPQLCDKLQAGGFKADAPTATLLLRSMETEGVLLSDNGRPKTWRLKNSGRRVPAPMIIRKAPAQQEASEAE
jgi:hypothetical protein